MSKDVTYGGYTFSPSPFLDLTNDPVFLSGKLDYLRQNVSLMGQLTGCGLSDLKVAKDELVAALSTGFQELTVGNTGFSYAKPVNVSFRESKLTKLAPYEISFEAYQNQDFSQFFGILNPVDVWSFTESDRRIISAEHNVSARAIKSSDDSLLDLRNFVNGRLNGFENISLFFSGDTTTLVSKTEELNRVTNSYGVSEKWSLSNAVDSYDTSGCIVRPNAKINWDGSDLSVSVDGSINGGISGSCSTGYFSPDDAKEFAQQSVESFKTLVEDDYYDGVFNHPSTYNYTIITGANSIDFSFAFSNPSNLNTGDVNHEFSVDFSAAKENSNINASIKGRVFYDSYKDLFLSGSPEEGSRYKKVEAFFSGVDPFAITQTHFNYFNEADLPYSNNPLNARYEKFNINKAPFSSEISYDYSYSNSYDPFSGQLVNTSISVVCDHSVPRWKITPTIDDSFCVQELFQVLEKKSITINGTVPTGISAIQAIASASGWMNQYIPSESTLTNHSCRTGDGNIALSKTFVIK